MTEVPIIYKPVNWFTDLFLQEIDLRHEKINTYLSTASDCCFSFYCTDNESFY